MEDTFSVNSVKALKPILFVWKISGLIPTQRMKALYCVCSAILHIGVTVYYPISMIASVASLKSKQVLFSNLALTVSLTMASLKLFNNMIHMSKIFEIVKHIQTLDSHVTNMNEKAYMEQIIKQVRRYFTGILIMVSFTICLVDIPVLLAEERRLVYPAWFPFDWQNSISIYRIIHAYQLVGIYIMALENVLSNTYPGIILCLLSGHLRVLGMRAAKIGYSDTQSAILNYQDLLRCIADHKTCLRIYNLCQRILSRVMIMQLVGTQWVLCITAIYMVLAKENLFEEAYLICYFTCMVMEISLSCYAGSQIMIESNEFLLSLYSCNWMDQDRRFKTSLLILMQLSQKPWEIMAGGIASVSLVTWMTVLRSAYSLFAVIIQMI